ncbi:cyclin-dependent kinase [Medicago truncatula]|uniref:Cyclin-dependent kinase n=1 Tax=Medicago truncatula TaxID=3880 RepID=A0A072TRV9_MEDTR|nr:cyclin-dependent kinase [Medicago truncatula]
MILTIPENQKNNGFPQSILNRVSMLKNLNLPNIVGLQAVMETEDAVFLVYEHFHTSLRKHLANPEFLNIPNWKKIFLRQALSGLAFCHIRKILPRDLKPHNILASVENLDVKKVKPSDFSAAKTTEPPLSPYSINA